MDLLAFIGYYPSFPQNIYSKNPFLNLETGYAAKKMLLKRLLPRK